MFGIRFLALKQFRLGGVLLGMGLFVGSGLWISWGYESRVLSAIRKNASCIYFPQADTFYDGSKRITFLTMEKSRSGYFNRHAILGTFQDETLKTFYWSFYAEAFHREYLNVLYPVPKELAVRFKACIDG